MSRLRPKDGPYLRNAQSTLGVSEPWARLTWDYIGVIIWGRMEHKRKLLHQNRHMGAYIGIMEKENGHYQTLNPKP